MTGAIMLSNLSDVAPGPARRVDCRANDGDTEDGTNRSNGANLGFEATMCS